MKNLLLGLLTLSSFHTFASRNHCQGKTNQIPNNLVSTDRLNALSLLTSEEIEAKQFNPNQKLPCGLEGTVDERIKDCSYQPSAEQEGFVLVARSQDFKEVHLEVSTGLLWSDRLQPTMNHYTAESACKSDLKEVAGISGYSWRLPSIDEYQEAAKNGIRKTLPNMAYWFWSSSMYPYSNAYAFLFGGYVGSADYYARSSSYDYSVRCVAKTK